MKITEWMGSISDDTVEFSDAQEISVERIKEKTMKKIAQDNKKKRRRIGKSAAAALTIVAVGLGGIKVYAQMKDTSVKNLLGSWVYGQELPEDKEEVLQDIGTKDFGIGMEKEEDGSVISKGIESNGTIVTPIAEISDGYNLYLQLRIEAPDGTKLAGLDSEKQVYQLFGYDDSVEHFPGYDGSWSGGDVYYKGELHNGAVEDEKKDNVITITVNYGLYQDTEEFKMPKVFHFEGLWIQNANKKYEKVLSGSWDIPLNHIQIKEPLVFHANGLGGVGTIKITELGYYPSYQQSDDDEDYILQEELKVVLKDGTIISPAETEPVWEEPFNLEDVDYVMIRGNKLNKK